ncbi:hypothetical protein Tco_1226535 [Tanacetum coccineum]
MFHNEASRWRIEELLDLRFKVSITPRTSIGQRDAKDALDCTVKVMCASCFGISIYYHVQIPSTLRFTYTTYPEDDLDIGSPGVEGPIFQDPPSPDYVPGPEGPPSPDYVPGPEEPEQAPPSPIYIPFVPSIELPPEFYTRRTMRYPRLRAANACSLHHYSNKIQSPGLIKKYRVRDPEAELEDDEEILL